MHDSDNLDVCGSSAKATPQIHDLPPVSCSTKPHAPSLLTLSGEIRNAIYEAVLLQDATIQIQAQDPARFKVSDPPFYQANGVSGVALLHTCRQIQYEASGILYGRNKFCKMVPEYLGGMRSMYWAMSWLDSIGTQSSSVRSVQIDYAWLFIMREKVDILPILKAIWKSTAHKNLDISLFTFPRAGSDYRWPDSWPAEDIANFTEGFTLLILETAHHLRRLFSVSKAIKAVFLEPGGRGAHILYFQTHGRGDSRLSQERIIIDDNGPSLTARDPEITGVMEVMSVRGIGDLIIGSVLSSVEPTTYVSTTWTTYIDKRSMSAVNKLFRHCIERHDAKRR